MARLLEHHAKAILGEAGVPTPRGQAARSPAEAASVARRLGGPVVVKALVPSNRRAKAGGVRFADTPPGAAEAAGAVLARSFDGRTAEAVLVEEQVAIERELYLSLLVDRDRARAIALLSVDGGVDVETAVQDAGRVEIVELDPFGRVEPDTFLEPWRRLGLAGDALAATVDVSTFAATAFFANEATILELNPIGLVEGGTAAVAVGALLAIDDAALGRHPELTELMEPGADRWRAPTALELEAARVAAKEPHRGTARFIELEGEIGVLSGGGGASLVVFESVRRAGGRPACFTEIGGNPTAEKVQGLADVVLRCPRVCGMLVAHNLTSNTQVDLIAAGVVAALRARGLDPRTFPVVAREAGTHDEAGRAVFEDAGVEYLGEEHSLESAARRIVERVREQRVLA